MDEAHPGAQLLGPAEIRQIAGRLGIWPAKRLGQNFVIDPGTIRRIVGLADLRPQDVVLEVGPGLGSLTLGLIEVAGRVIAVEVDQALAGELPRTIAARAPGLAGRLEVVTADALGLQEPPGQPPTALVANLPYNVAVPVVLHLLEVMPSIRRVLVMVQAEVADRMCAQPGSRTYGVPSVPDGGAPGAGHHSVGRAAVFAVIDAAFAQRRKTLRSALASWAGSAQAAERVLRDAGVDPTLRGEAIGIDQYIRIALAASRARTIIES